MVMNLLKPILLRSKVSLLTVALWGVVSPIALAFSDTQSHWANPCINQLSTQRLVSGYPDNSFRPQSTVTRAEFAILMLNAFSRVEPTRQAPAFSDVPSSHWAYRAIRDAYARQFFSGYPDGSFQPSQPIPRTQAIAILANAANMSSSEAAEVTLHRYFDDAQQVPAYARRAIAAGTVGRIVVNYPNVRQLRPNQPTTRGEVAALLCQSLNLPRTVPLEYVGGDRSLFAIPPEMGGVSHFSAGLATVYVNSKLGYMDTQGTIVIQPQFDEALPFSEELAAVRVGERWGFIDRTGQLVIQPQFNYVPEGFSDGLARVFTNNGEVGFINKTGQFVIQPQLYSTTAFSEGLASFSVNGNWGYMDKTGAIAIEPQFKDAKAFADGLAPVQITSGYWGYINRSGEMVVEPQFSNAEPFSEGLAAVEMNVVDASNRWGYIDRNGNTVIPAQFYLPNYEFRGSVLTAFSGGIAMARIGDQVGFVDRSGRWTVIPNAVALHSVSAGLAKVNVGGTWVREQTGCTHSDGCFYSINLQGGKWGYIRVPR
ncbi:WG repeat-containing protein [Leptolyngbya sp. FACHB-671]|uniref:WG repeat-containing protein n=1 Tax=Leptolyngbya sp. FACHB-671 TaxID=2692812 RepID=UPI0016871E00|nr:WG repeat-containing protein [Leptolyngbya sp. FACHB-671]